MASNFVVVHVECGFKLLPIACGGRLTHEDFLTSGTSKVKVSVIDS